MNPIELGKAIAKDGIAIITAVMLILVVGLVWYLIRRQTKREDKHYEERTKRQDKRDEDQKEERDYYRGIVNKELQKNVELNLKGITLQKEMVKEFQRHNGHISIFQKKAVESLSLICDRLINPLKGIGDRRKINEAVEVERRK